MRKHAHHWRDIYRSDDDAVAEVIRNDRIDILVDLAGHTASNRLPLFARKPAPIQAMYLGYPCTSGLASMDYKLTDAQADPPGLTEALHTEQLCRLPHSAWCYSAQPNCPEVAQAPFLARGYITFGSFNAMSKLTARMIQVWSSILQIVPNSRIVLKNLSLGDASTAQRIGTAFAQHGIAPDRVELRGSEPDRARHLRTYDLLDIALDPYPYHGTTTTCEALYMGVPVVSLAGAAHVSRVGLSLLVSIGLPELVAQSAEEYVRIAVELAGDNDRLSMLRQTMRQRMQCSPLMDEAGFVRDLESAYRDMWRRWCKSDVPPVVEA